MASFGTGILQTSQLANGAITSSKLAAEIAVGDHGTASTDMLVNAAYGTGAAPAAATTTEGAIYITYV